MKRFDKQAKNAGYLDKFLIETDSVKQDEYLRQYYRGSVIRDQISSHLPDLYVTSESEFFLFIEKIDQ